MNSNHLVKNDAKVYNLIKQEETRQEDKLSLIPSENYFSPAVREAIGSVLMHKYSEGNIGARYYEGNQFIDEIETLTKDRARKLFKLPKDWDVNVQALSGSNANLAVYMALLKPNATIMSMYLYDGGHLSHGWSYEPKSKTDKASNDKKVESTVYLGGKRKVNISSRLFNVVQYKTDPKTSLFDYEALLKVAKKYKPDILITGGTAYPRNIDFKKMKAIADSVGALYMTDIAHEAGLVAGGALQSPVGIADVVTMTTHKTLRSGRGAIILAHKDLIAKINKGVLPGVQGGPFNNNIAGICVGLGEALKPEFKIYAKQVIVNAQALASELINLGFEVLTGGTDKHLILVNLTNKGIFGKKASRALDIAGIVLNMNTIPYDTRSPMDPSAIRLGTPFVTTRGMKEKEMKIIAGLISRAIDAVSKYSKLDFVEFEKTISKLSEIKAINAEVKKLCGKFPLSK
jgi:glycine hydroxymethyltransferase